MSDDGRTRTGARRLTPAAGRYWGWVVADGVLGVVVGLIALVWPGVTVLALAVLLGIGLLFQGAMQFSAGLNTARGTPGRGWVIFFAVLAIVAGLICLTRPGAGLFAIILGVTIWFFAAGVNELIAAFTYTEQRVWNAVAGVVSLLAGLILIVNPGVALSTAALVAGTLFVLRGLSEIWIGWQLRRIVR